MSGVQCPHCGSEGRIRNSRAETPTVRNCNVECKNEACGHRFVAIEERTYTIAYTLQPSRTPNPSVRLPGAYHPSLVKLKQAANDPGPGGPEVPRPAAANDDGALSEVMG